MSQHAQRLWHPLYGLAFDIDRLLAWPSTAAPAAPTAPRLNVYAHDDGAELVAELPGVARDGLEIAVLGDTVTLKGTWPQAPEDAQTVLRRERRTGSFTRTVALPFRVEAKAVEATLVDGVLTLRLPRAAEDRPRRINVTAG